MHIKLLQLVCKLGPVMLSIILQSCIYIILNLRAVEETTMNHIIDQLDLSQ